MRLFEKRLVRNKTTVQPFDMKQNSALAQNELYTRTDADLIAHANVLIGPREYQITLKDAVRIVANFYNRRARGAK